MFHLPLDVSIFMHILPRMDLFAFHAPKKERKKERKEKALF
jgi:hypothetical protein